MNKKQVLFNKQINFFFDIKHIKQSKYLNFDKKHSELIKNKKNNTNKINKIIVKSLNGKKIKNKDKDYYSEIFKIQNYLKKNKLKKFFKYFLIHGSLADLNYIKGWSDIDTFVVIKNSAFKSKKNILALKKKISKLYEFFIRICPLQHHGLILFSEFDLENYSRNYLPIEALSANVNILDKKKEIKIKHFNDNSNTQLKILKDMINRLNLLKYAKKFGIYKHHPLNGKFLQFPIKSEKKQMFQLFCHIGYMNTLPAYYLTCIGKSINKKDLFRKFNRIFKNRKIKKLMKKNEKVRFLWEKNQYKNKDNFIIPSWITKILGKRYLDECIMIFEKLIKDIMKKNETKTL